MYQCRCRTCETTRLLDDLECAQATFNECAEQQHEIAMRRVEPPLDRQPMLPENVGGADPTPGDADTTNSGPGGG